MQRQVCQVHVAVPVAASAASVMWLLHLVEMVPVVHAMVGVLRSRVVPASWGGLLGLHTPLATPISGVDGPVLLLAQASIRPRGRLGVSGDLHRSVPVPATT